jgi:hypothetical protein
MCRRVRERSPFNKQGANSIRWHDRYTVLLAFTTAALVLTGCGGGAVYIGDGVGLSLNVPPPNDGVDVLTAAFPEPAGRNCANGGTRVDAGSDTNRNGVLDAAEVQSMRYVCSGQGV